MSEPHCTYQLTAVIHKKHSGRGVTFVHLLREPHDLDNRYQKQVYLTVGSVQLTRETFLLHGRHSCSFVICQQVK